MNKDESEKAKKTKKTKKAKKKSHVDKDASAKIIRDESPKILKWINNNFIEFIQLVLVFATFLLALGTFSMATSTRQLSELTHQSNERAEKLFVGQNKPLIDVIPISIIQGERKDGTKMCATRYSVVNYSGFDAYNIGYDIKYGSDWISEWVKAKDSIKEIAKKKADDNKKEKVEKRVILNHSYISRPKVIIPKLMSGETIGGDFKWPPLDASGELDFKRLPRYASGEFDLEAHVVDKDEGFPVLMRVTWENKSGHVFDEIHKYKLLCTDVGQGLSFTFIPEGIISQKNMESRTGLDNSGE